VIRVLQQSNPESPSFHPGAQWPPADSCIDPSLEPRYSLDQEGSNVCLGPLFDLPCTPPISWRVDMTLPLRPSPPSATSATSAGTSDDVRHVASAMLSTPTTNGVTGSTRESDLSADLCPSNATHHDYVDQSSPLQSFGIDTQQELWSCSGADLDLPECVIFQPHIRTDDIDYTAPAYKNAALALTGSGALMEQSVLGRMVDGLPHQDIGQWNLNAHAVGDRVNLRTLQVPQQAGPNHRSRSRTASKASIGSWWPCESGECSQSFDTKAQLTQVTLTLDNGLTRH
jgi:hypothetical protein